MHVEITELVPVLMTKEAHLWAARAKGVSVPGVEAF